MYKWMEEFKNPSKEYRAVPFWSWNDKLDPESLRWQIREMEKAGLGGFFMHARGGLQTEYMSGEWMDCIQACIDEGKKTGMNAWCYDEEGWPSGFAGGTVTAMGDRYHVRWLEFKEVGEHDGESDQVLGRYRWDNETNRVTFIPSEDDATAGDVQKTYIIRHASNPYYIDILNPEVVRAFIECTYEKYYTQFHHSFGQGMPGFFTDEPQYAVGRIPWSYILPERFKERFGYELIPVLPALFMEYDGCQAVRYDFWSLVNELYVTSFGKQIYDWCHKHNCQFTGHVMAEDSLHAQMAATAGAMPFYEYMHIPGMDWLGRAIESPVIPKQVSSAANQLGKKFVLSETFALCGWDVSFEELKWIAEWQYVNGVNLMCQHLEGYTLRGLRKRDYPPSLFYQQPWWKEYRSFNDYFARLGVLLTSGSEISPVLLLHPMKSAWLAYNARNNDSMQKLDKDFVEATKALAGLHVGYHYGDETIIARHGKIEGDAFVVGLCKYKAVVMPSMIGIDKSTVDLLNRFAANGGRIISIGSFPHYCNDLEKLKQLKENAVHIHGEKGELHKLLREWQAPVIRTATDGGEISSIHCMSRDLGDEQLFYMVNHDQVQAFETVVSVPGNGRLRKISAENGEIMDIDCIVKDGYTTVCMQFQPMQSHILLFDNTRAQHEKSDDRTVQTVRVTQDWEIERVGLNTLTLDYCSYRIDEGEWQGPLPIIKLMEILLELKTSCEIELRFSFDIRMDLTRNRTLFLAIETADDFDIFVNGEHIIYRDQGWWKDSAFKRVDIKEYVVPGSNEVLLKRTFYQDQKVYDVLFGEDVLETERNKLTFDVELESIYVVGDFGVISKSSYTAGERKALFTDGPFEIIELPQKVKTGDITQQGFCFFAESIQLGQDFKIIPEERQRILLDVGKPDAVLSKVFVNGQWVKTLLWAPYPVDITDWVKPGVNHLSIELFPGNRNLLGPHHHIKGELYAVGPSSFTDKPGWADGPNVETIWSEGYCFVRFGLRDKTEDIQQPEGMIE